MNAQTIFLVAIAIFGITGEVLSPKVPQNNKEISDVESASDFTTPYVEHKHRKHKCGNERHKERCKRYAQNYYYSTYNYPRVPVYVPPRCYSYCYSCPTSSCRRRCPMPRPPATIIVRPTTPVEKTCNCDPKGSKYPPCDPNTGNCMCKINYVGRTCNICRDGYWKNSDGECVRCICNEFGAKDSNCNKTTGQCNCTPGVHGITCDSCLPNYFGTVNTGCTECEPCNKKGHICGRNGKCACPPLTAGQECERCIVNAWGHQGEKGCKACNCSTTGSHKLQCDQDSGKCTCNLGFEGQKCDRCSFGHHGYPNCRKCNCNSWGTEQSECKGDACTCNEDGLCKCKKYVEGGKCDTCKEGTFGVHKESNVGCTKCFCFERSNKCIESKYNWDKIQFQKPIDNNELSSDFDTLSLPRQFLGDRTVSYNGYLTVIEKEPKDGYFSVILHGNGIKLSSKIINSSEVRLNEKNWNITDSNNGHCREELFRDCFLLVLQNITQIIVDGRNMEITEVLLDVAKPNQNTSPAYSIEKCECPPEYTGLSCQDPNEGYYRHFPKKNHWIDDVIGVAKMCECNGYSNQCDSNTGFCKNCSDFRDGPHCELCVAGHYMDQDEKKCLPCFCPSLEENNAKSCKATNDGFVCSCKEGYNGTKCEFCSNGFFREISSNKCIPCGCDTHGSYSKSCDNYGTCKCKPGFEGVKCNQCHNEREYMKEGVCIPCDKCTQLLFNEIDELRKAVNETFGMFVNGVSPPWKKLVDFGDRKKLLSKKFLEKKHQYDKIHKEYNIAEYKHKVQKLKDKTQTQNSKAAVIEANSNNLQNNSTILTTELKDLNEEFQKIIDNLSNFGTKHVSVKDAIKQAKKILHDIKEKVVGIQFAETDNQNICADVSKYIGSSLQDSPNIHVDINELKSRLRDIEKLTTGISQRNAIADDLNRENSERLETLKLKLPNLNQENILMRNKTDQIIKTLQEINGAFGNLEAVYNDMNNLKFEDAKILEDRLKRDLENLDDAEDLTSLATKHAEKLEDILNKYKGIFNFTKDEWKRIRASGAYDEIAKGIKNAFDEANEAIVILENVNRAIQPTDNSDGLTARSNVAHAYSDRLKRRIDNLKGMSENFSNIKNNLEELKYELLENGKANNNLTQLLRSIDSKISSQNVLAEDLNTAIENSTNISEKMRQLDRDLNNLNLTSRYNLFKTFQTYLTMVSEEERNALKRNLRLAKQSIDSINIQSTEDSIDSTNFQRQKVPLNSIKDRVRALQNKIQYARQTANSIKVALDLSYNCSMTYHLPQNEIFERLSISYHCTTCNLFSWSNNNNDFINLTVVNEIVLLSISVNMETTNLNCTTNTHEVEENNIFIEMIGSKIKLKCKSDEKTTNLGTNSKIVLYRDDNITIGNLNNNLKTTDIEYIYKVTVNYYDIGLWNFAHSSGNCSGRQRNKTRTDDKEIFYFGQGYRSYDLKELRVENFNLKFSIATFDEDSLIYLAQERENPCAFIAIYLENGYVTLKVQHNNNQTMQITDSKVNTGKTFIIELTMQYDNPYQLYKLNDKTKRTKLPKKNVFKIKRAYHYTGGVPPIFNGRCLNNVNTTSFLGLLSLSQPQINYNKSVGVVYRKELNLNKAWFNENGYLKFLAKTQDPSEISLRIVPINDNCSIMNISRIGLISLENRRLKIKFIDDSTYISQNPLHLSDYNSVAFHVTSGDLNVQVNNGEIEKTKYNLNNTLRNLEISMGGSNFNGGIRNIFLNNEELFFNHSTVKEFRNVEIGRESAIVRGPAQLRSPALPNSISNIMQNTEGCALPGNYLLDSSAVKFGDKENSFVKIKTLFWKSNNYTIDLEFRTFYSEGILFLTSGSGKQNQHYNLLALKDGRLHLYIKGKRRKKLHSPILVQQKVNDGKWHKVQILKKAKYLTITLDGREGKPARVAKNRVRNEIWLGGIPHDYTDYRELKEKTNPFRGCIKMLMINNEHQGLMKNSKNVLAQNITQCFPHIEEGAYFGGDSYALYNNNFRVTQNLKLGFEFKTAEQNGVLLSASTSNNSPAISVELQNGAVVMTVDIGNGVISKVTKNLGSEFALCDNRWHNVTAWYISSELTVIVDGIMATWLHNVDVNSLEEIVAPLYVGGIPANAPHGTLKVRENFKGCIRKLTIGNELMDWSDMEEVNHVLLNSCPIVPGQE